MAPQPVDIPNNVKANLLGWTEQGGWSPLDPAAGTPDFILYFGSTGLLARRPGPVDALRARFPDSIVAGSSTAGEIRQGTVTEGSLVAIAVRLRESRVRAESIEVTSAAESFAAAAELGRRLAAPDLRHVFVLSDGLVVNGTSLTQGFRSTLPVNVSVTGGLAGDGTYFAKTLVGLGSEVATNRIVAIGFYGNSIRVGCGSAGGWEPFGPRRLVTHSSGNILYELDGQPALALYKRYLGERAADLPATGLLFPLQLLADKDTQSGLVRTILAVDEQRQSLTFAGDIPQGHYVRLMKASHAALVGGAGAAAERTAQARVSRPPGFVLMVSCVGRKIVMGQRIEEEVDAVLATLGTEVPAVGFYSYGEICPAGTAPGCDLHNQTMTITAVFEDRP